jgi:hypothetical protein
MRSAFIVFISALGLLHSTVPVVAHHAFAAEYDVAKPVTVKGVVTKVEWTNPHARFYVDGVDEKGTKTTWNFELASPNSLVRHGWSRKAVNVGDQVTVKAYLAKASADLGKANAAEVTLSDGRHVFAGSSLGDGSPQQ